MIEYQYIAYTEDKTVVKGVQAAASSDLAGKILTSRGYRLLSLKPIPRFLPRLTGISLTVNRIPTDAVVLFSRQLALLLESGVDLVAALDLLRVQATNHRFKNVLASMIADLRSGDHLSQAMRKHSDVFSKLYVQSAVVGEQSGTLEAILRQSADYLERDAVNIKSAKNAMRYPAIVAVVAVAVVAVLTIFVLPAFTQLYSQLGVELPAITRFVFGGVAWFSRYGLIVLAGIVCAMIAIYFNGKTPHGKLTQDRLILRLPVLGRVIHLNELIRCCRSMAILQKGGLPVSEIMGLAVEASNNLVVKQALTQVHRDVLKGQGLSKPMAKNPIFLPMMVQMVAVGETSGNLDSTLKATADSYETEANDRMSTFIEMIQPTITIVLAVGVGLIASALISAMYSLYGQWG